MINEINLGKRVSFVFEPDGENWQGEGVITYYTSKYIHVIITKNNINNISAVGTIFPFNKNELTYIE